MEFGLPLPTAGDPTSPDVILRVAQEAERMGLASVWMSDGLLRPVQQPIDFGGGISITVPPESATQCDAIETLAYVAARTSRIQLGTSVIGALFQNPGRPCPPAGHPRPFQQRPTDRRPGPRMGAANVRRGRVSPAGGSRL